MAGKGSCEPATAVDWHFGLLKINQRTKIVCKAGEKKKAKKKDRSSEVLVSSGKMTGCDDPCGTELFIIVSTEFGVGEDPTLDPRITQL